MSEQYADPAPQAPVQPSLPGMEPTKHSIMVINESGQADTFTDMKALREASLPDGTYEVWRFGGTFKVEAVPARARVKFESAVRRPRDPSKPKAPRKPRKAKKEATSGA